MLRGNDCLTSCDLDEYYDTFEKRCKNCPLNCVECSDFNTCTKCDGIVYVLDSSTNKCVNRCPTGKNKML